MNLFAYTIERNGVELRYYWRGPQETCESAQAAIERENAPMFERLGSRVVFIERLK